MHPADSAVDQLQHSSNPNLLLLHLHQTCKTHRRPSRKCDPTAASYLVANYLHNSGTHGLALGFLAISSGVCEGPASYPHSLALFLCWHPSIGRSTTAQHNSTIIPTSRFNPFHSYPRIVILEVKGWHPKIDGLFAVR